MEINSSKIYQKKQVDIELEKLLVCLRKIPKWRHCMRRKEINDKVQLTERLHQQNKWIEKKKKFGIQEECS
jgi:hypothetical protein